MKLFLFFGSLIVRMFFKDRGLSMYEVSITIFTKQSLSFLFSIFFWLRIIEEKGKGLEAEELSQPNKNHQKKGGYFIWISAKAGMAELCGNFLFSIIH